MKKNKVIIIGAGLGGLTAACYLAKAGCEVTILEKNSWVGGRIQTWKEQGFTIDMGPSWYWMPQVFEDFFADFGTSVSDYYQLKRLNPSYRIYFKDEAVDLPADQDELCDLFERYETGAGNKLKRLLSETKRVYQIAMRSFIPKSYHSFFDVLTPSLFQEGFRILSTYNGFQSVESYLSSFFKHPKLIKMLEFPIFFLGGSSSEIPAVYSIMNHVDMDQGTWYPIGGMAKVGSAFQKLAESLGVKIYLNEEVVSLPVHQSRITQVVTTKQTCEADYVISNADYPYTENTLLSPENQSYSPSYWEKRALAPSAFLVYLCLNKKVTRLLHHTLFFHTDWDAHNQNLFQKPKWPENPLYYVSCPTKTDPTLAPKDQDILVILIPLAAGLEDNPSLRETYYNKVLRDLEDTTGEPIRDSIRAKKIYALNDFIQDFHAFKGNAYGLAQTLWQTALFRPSNRSKKIKNLSYTGQFTVPGIGLPMVVISGKLAAHELLTHL
ncbi:phytoene desaturase [Candidatus Roizmanbacteria bacterium]|nr:phytoene desaturase [Candidatus Roizmanbacteria bacterium]